ncbi:potassium channel family protein [Streptomyces sp. NPDC003863]
MVTVVAVWALIVAVGWGLICWPHMPEDFSYAAGPVPSEHAGPLDALYISLVTLATLGLGGIAPTSGWLRVLAPMEALVGFVLLSATVAWILGIYPAPACRRAPDLRLSHVRRSRAASQALDSDGGAALLDGLASALSTITVRQLRYAVGLADQATAAHQPDVRPSASVLRRALEDLAVVLHELFLRTGEGAARVFAACADDHGQQPQGPDGPPREGGHGRS